MSERVPLLGNDQTAQRSPPENIGQNSNEPLNNPSKIDLIWIMAALWSAVFLSTLDGTVTATLISPIGSYFQKAHQASYLGTSYLLSVCCFTPLYGRLSDILGRKGAMLFALGLFGTGTFLCAIAPSMEALILARAIAGMGGGGIRTVSSICVSDLVPLKKRGLYQGFQNILYGTGSGLGGPLGGFLSDRWGWRIAFFVQVPIIALSFVLVAIKVNIRLPERTQTLRERLARIDWLGSLTLVTAIGSLLLGVSLKTAEELPWSNPLVWGLLITSVAAATMFVSAQNRWSQEPILPLRLLSERNCLAVSICHFALSMMVYTMVYNVPLYFSAVRLRSSTDSGLHLLPYSVFVTVGSLVAGWVIRSTGRYWWLLVISATLCVLASTLLALWNEKTSEIDLWFDIIPAGFGMGSIFTASLIALISSVKRSDIAVATGISYLFRSTGQVLGVSLGGAVSQAVLSHSLRQKIHGPGAAEIIKKIRHSTAIIPTLEPELRKAAIDSWAFALRTVFIAQTAVSVVIVLACLPLQEFDLSETHEKRKPEPLKDGGAESNS